MRERREGLVNKVQMGFLSIKEISKSSREGSVTVGDLNTVMEINQKSGEHTEPELARGGGICIAGLETLIDEGTELVEGTRGISTFLCIREVNSSWGVSCGNGMEGASFNKSGGEGPHYDQWGRVRG